MDFSRLRGVLELGRWRVLTSSVPLGDSDPKWVVDAGESNFQASRNILIAIDALLRANRIESAIQILETELGRGC